MRMKQTRSTACWRMLAGAVAVASRQPPTPVRAGRCGETAGRAATPRPGLPRRARGIACRAADGDDARPSRTRSSSRYCVGCHNDRNKDRTSGLSFQSFDAATVADHADTVERMIRRLRAGHDAAGRREASRCRRRSTALVDAFETRIDRAAALNPESRAGVRRSASIAPSTSAR